MTYLDHVPLEACSSSFSTSSSEASAFGLSPSSTATAASASASADEAASQRKKKISEKLTDMAIMQKIRKAWKSKNNLQEDATPPPEFWW